MKKYNCDICLFIWEYIQWITALLIVIFAFLIIFFFGLIIYFHSPGPLLFTQLREGKNGKPFKMYKLRTMTVNAQSVLDNFLTENEAAKQEWLSYGRLANDPRIAGKVAKFARRFSIDELPQFLNVAKGEMNLVGPRPLPNEIANRMSDSNLEIRRTVLPGITGLWQVSGRSELQITEIGKLDKLYVKNRRIWIDIWIILRTFRAVVIGRGAY